MKKINYFIYILLFTLALTSCNDWLDVAPEDEIGEEELFADGEGYRNALNGVYKAMAEYGLYGKHLTWGIMDALAQYYTYDNARSIHDMAEGAAKYDFKQEDFKKDIESVWSKAYNAVANCNNIIQNIEGADPEKFVYKGWEKNMIWGEALALRAFIQFDMLRLFAPAPVANPTKAYIPYISVYPSYVPTKLTVKECLERIIDDLKAALPLVAEHDTLVDANRLMVWFETPGAGDERFIRTRGYRLNYWAVTALLARVYLYAEMPDEAYEKARQLIDAHEKKRFFSFEKYVSTAGRKLYGDVIAGLYAPKVYEWEAELNDFTAPSSYNWQYLEVFDVEKLYEGDLYYDDYYEKTTSRDVRFKEQLSDIDGDGTYVSLKYRRVYGTSATDEVSNTLVPLIRMSEMYYIAAEVMAEKDLEQAKEYLFKVKSGRGFYSSDIRTMRERINSVPLLKAAILNDARRDFIGEGQMFFMYKRLGEPIPAPEGAIIPAAEEKFVIPVPDSEISIK